MSAPPKRAAQEILAGEPHAAARRWLGPATLVMFALFALDTYLVAAGALTRVVDIPIATLVQSIGWGPVANLFELINASAGYWQVLLGLAAIVALFWLDRRAGWLMLIGSISSLLDNVIKLVISRQRPAADIVHILTPATGFSYPSGHAVFFTWMSFMLAAALAPRVKPVLRPVLWGGAALVIVLTCLARVWAGDHWPSDVVGGVLLGAGWSAFVLWLPERWLPSPSIRWFRARFHRPVSEHLRRPALGVAILAALAAAAITAIVVMHPFLPIDATVENGVQATNWGPLALTFPGFTWIGDAKGAVAEAILFVLILIFNRRAWRFALAAATTGAWYVLLNRIILRPRPTTAQVLQVTEHPAASSFPSGHTIFIVTLTTVLMLCLGYRFLPRWARPIGWVLVAATVVACGIARIDTGAHWPTDVLAAVLISVAWLSLLVAVRPISDGVLNPAQSQSDGRRARRDPSRSTRRLRLQGP